MRAHVVRALLAAAAAGASIAAPAFGAAVGVSAAVAASAQPSRQALTAATPGSPSTSTITTAATAGYEASGRYFRYIQAVITVPDQASSPTYSRDYIQLGNGSLNRYGDPTGDQFVRAGVEPCLALGETFADVSCPAGDWGAFVASYDNSLSAGPSYVHVVPLLVQPGDGVFFSIYYDQAGNELHFVITPPAVPGSRAIYLKTRAYGPIFDHADAVTSFTTAAGGAVSLPPFATQFRITQFLRGALTTYSGARGSFAGSWRTSMVEATTNGLPYPYGHPVLSPSYLWGDGQAANGAARWGDAFGVWART